MTPEEEAAKKASEAIYDEQYDKPVESFDEKLDRATHDAQEAYRGEGDEVPSFEQLASEYNEKHHLSQRELENMSEKEANEYINNVLSDLRQQAIDENRIITFTMKDEKGNMCKWEIKPNSLSTDKENCFDDGDNKINILKTDLKTGKKEQVHKDKLFGTEIKRTLYRSIIRAPGAVIKGIKNSVKENIREGINAAIQSFGR